MRQWLRDHLLYLIDESQVDMQEVPASQRLAEVGGKWVRESIAAPGRGGGGAGGEGGHQGAWQRWEGRGREGIRG